MPDFTIESAYICRSNVQWETDIQGRTGLYTVRWERDFSPYAKVQYHYTCTCKGYKFSRHCSHIDTADRIRCKWNEEIEPSVRPMIINGEPRCPHCGKDVEVMRVAV